MISSSYVPKTLPSNILIRGILLLISVTCMDVISFTGAMAQSLAHSPTLKYYAIAHLISTPSLVTWAANQGGMSAWLLELSSGPLVTYAAFSVWSTAESRTVFAS
jgi:hypothetical protein